MDFARMWNTIGVRIAVIVLGVVLIWVGVEITKPLGYVLEAVGLVIALAALVNINRVARRQQNSEL